jgi:hypothetical protein
VTASSTLVGFGDTGTLTINNGGALNSDDLVIGALGVDFH